MNGQMQVSIWDMGMAQRRARKMPVRGVRRGGGEGGKEAGREGGLMG
jgi:hypothetical protein